MTLRNATLLCCQLRLASSATRSPFLKTSVSQLQSFSPRIQHCALYQSDSRLAPPDPKRPRLPPSEAQYGKMVYVGSIGKNVMMVKMFSFGSSCLGLLCQPILLKHMEALNVWAKGAVFSFFGFFIYITPFLFHMVVKRYVFRMYYDEKTKQFTAVTVKFVPSWKYITFQREAVEVPPIGGAFTVVTVKQGNRKIPLFINPPEFVDDEAYKLFMSYDLPIDVLRKQDAKDPEAKN